MRRTVLFLHGSPGGYGADRQLHHLACGLDPSRYRALVVVSERGPLARALELDGVDVHVTALAVMRRRHLSGRGVAGLAARLVRNRRELIGLARERDVSIVHTNMSIVLPGHEVAAAIGAPHLVHVREIYAGAGGRLGGALWPLYRRLLLRADALACVSAAVADQFAGCGQAFVVHDAVRGPLRLPPRHVARAALDLPQERFVVAVAGRVSDWKGQDVLARALARPPLASIGAIGLVAGDAAPDQNHHETALTGLASELGVGERLRLLGFRRDVETVYAAADAVAVPSVRPDALPNSALEVAAAGIPLVATRTGGLPEIVRERETGWLVPPGDADALAQALAAVAADPAGARRLAAVAAAQARVRFSLDGMLDAVQACYGRLAG